MYRKNLRYDVGAYAVSTFASQTDYSQRIPIADLSTLYRQNPNPLCYICDNPVQLETAKTDEGGRAIQEECHLLKLLLQEATGDV